MKKFFTIMLALVTATTLAFAGSDVTVDCGKQVQISATPATGWHFVKWDDENTDNPRTLTPSADAHYVAIFALNQYQIVFKNYDGTVLKSETLNHGDAVTSPVETPTKPATVQYTYVFDSWSPNISSTATDNAIYTAQYTEVLNKYTVTFQNYDGTVLQSSEVSYGTTPSYTGETPTKPSDSQYSYTFTGWDKNLEPVSGVVTYTAQYSNTTNTYTITVEDPEHGTTTGGGTYQYGSTQEITATADDCYRFVRWSDGNTDATRTITVDGNKTYTAIFEKIQYTITTAPDDAAHGSTSAVEL